MPQGPNTTVYMIRAGVKGEEPGDDESAGKYADNSLAVVADVMLPGSQDRVWKHHQRKD